MGDSCDLVPLGAYYGKGKRTGVYGAYLLACYNAEDETYESVCKIGTGFNDEALQSLHASASSIRRQGRSVSGFRGLSSALEGAGVGHDSARSAHGWRGSGKQKRQQNRKDRQKKKIARLGSGSALRCSKAGHGQGPGNRPSRRLLTGGVAYSLIQVP